MTIGIVAVPLIHGFVTGQTHTDTETLETTGCCPDNGKKPESMARAS